MDYRCHLIRGASCLAVALGLAMALPTTESAAQPLGPSLSHMQSRARLREGPGATRTGPRSASWATRLARGSAIWPSRWLWSPASLLVGPTRPPMSLVVRARRSYLNCEPNRTKLDVLVGTVAHGVF
jgi:hypothetical protein